MTGKHTDSKHLNNMGPYSLDNRETFKNMALSGIRKIMNQKHIPWRQAISGNYKDTDKSISVPIKLPETWSGSITSDIRIADCSFVVFDTELSGLNPKNDFMVSIGAVKMTGGIIHLNQEFYRLIKPVGQRINKMSTKSIEIHGITPDELANQEILDVILPDFLNFIKDAVLVGHFVNFDLKFLIRALKRRKGGKLANYAIDTHSLHDWLRENSSDFKKHYHGGSARTDLFSIAQAYGITLDKTHNAVQDAFIIAQLFQRFIHFLPGSGIHTLNDLLDICKA